MRREFDNPSQMRKWLQGAAGVAILAVGLQADLDSLYTNITSPMELASAMAAEERYALFCQPSRPCFVEYENTGSPDLFPELDYDQFMAAFVVKVKLRKTGILYGGPENLLKKISGCDFLVCMSPAQPGSQAGYVLVRMPEDPAAIAELKSVLLSESIMVTVPDGTGEMHEGNVTMGKGFNPV